MKWNSISKSAREAGKHRELTSNELLTNARRDLDVIEIALKSNDENEILAGISHATACITATQAMRRRIEVRRKSANLPFAKLANHAVFSIDNANFYAKLDANKFASVVDIEGKIATVSTTFVSADELAAIVDEKQIKINEKIKRVVSNV